MYDQRLHPYILRVNSDAWASTSGSMTTYGTISSLADYCS